MFANSGGMDAKVTHCPLLGQPGATSVVLHSSVATAKPEREQETATAWPKLCLMTSSNTRPSLK